MAIQMQLKVLFGRKPHDRPDIHKEKTTIGLISKSNFARAALFFVHFFAIVLHDYNVILPETS